MAPLSSPLLLLLGLLGAGLVPVATAAPEWNQEEMNRNSDCDNGCFFGSFPGGSCTDDAACMCTQQKYRERYFCCMADKCAASVLPDSIVRQHSECGARNMDFSFDVKAVCGVEMPGSSSSSSSPPAPTPATVTVTTGAATVTVAPTTAGTGGSSSSSSSQASAGAAAASSSSPPASNGAPNARGAWAAGVVVVGGAWAAGVWLW